MFDSPLVLYALQRTLTYAAYQNLDAVTFNGLTQLKVLSSALCCYLVLGKEQSAMQVASLGLLTFSTMVFQGSWKDWTTQDWLSASMA
jgi:UDP-sugar transporter A1/2/3